MIPELTDRYFHESSNLLVINWLTLTMMSDMILDVALVTNHDVVLLAEVTDLVLHVIVTFYLVRILLPVVSCLTLKLIINPRSSKFVNFTELAFEDVFSLFVDRGHLFKTPTASCLSTTDQHHGLSKFRMENFLAKSASDKSLHLHIILLIIL